MLPFPVVLVGVDEDLAPQIRRELGGTGIEAEAEFPAAVHAITAFRDAMQDKRLLIVQFQSAEDAPGLKRLSAAFAGWPILALVDIQVDPENLFRANRAGASQLVALPLAPQDFQEAVACIAGQCGAGSSQARVIAVTGATGGAGSTLTAINLAYEMAARHGKSCILAELSLQIGALGTYLDLRPKTTLIDLLWEIDRLDSYMLKQAVTPFAENLDVLPGPQEVGPPVKASPRELVQVIDTAKEIAPYVVVDVPCTYNDFQFEVLAHADEMVLVGTQTIPSVRAMRMIIDSVGNKSESGSRLVINRYDPRLEGFTLEDLERLLKVSELRKIANDPSALKAAADKGKPLNLVAPNSAALADIRQLAATMLGVAHPQGGGGKASMFGRLVSAFSR
jgi:pilus assembly protein CpaE